jgi:hypothetical protein
MYNERRSTTARLTLTNQAAIEANLVRVRHARAEHSGLPVDGDAAGANPILGLATRGKSSARQYLLNALAFGIRAVGAAAPWCGCVTTGVGLRRASRRGGAVRASVVVGVVIFEVRAGLLVVGVITFEVRTGLLVVGVISFEMRTGPLAVGVISFEMRTRLLVVGVVTFEVGIKFIALGVVISDVRIRLGATSIGIRGA